jgi:NitT/TauT family transport system substrate-binding protein
MKAKSSRRPLLVAGLSLLAASLALLPGGCGKSGGEGGRPKLKVAYLGLTCEAPIFVAKEKGFFEEEGLDVELVKTDWNGLRQGLHTGNFDANHTLIMYLLQPIAEGLDLKITGGIHTGCLRVQVPTGSKLTVKDLKGKKVGVPTHLYSPPHMFATRVVAAAGLNPRLKKEGGDIEWLPMPPDQLGQALEDGKIDALATTDPIGTILLGAGKVRTIADQAEDDPYKDEYCCVVVVSGKLVESNPEAAAKVTRALLKAAKWVQTNPTAAANLSVEKKYLASNAKMNAQALSKLNYRPGVDRCRKSVLQAARDMDKAGLLKAPIPPEKLAEQAWQDLDGVSDKWLEGVKVERVAGGGRPPRLSPAEFAAFLEDPTSLATSCCCAK